MEKFSAYRDPGTGIQPFLPPVPPAASHVLANVLLPVRSLLGLLRTLLVLSLLLVYILLVPLLSVLLAPVPPVRRVVSYILTAFLSRGVLFILGFLWISEEHVKKKRGRGYTGPESWNPRAGDIIVSNWVSWIELLWLAFRFDPIFVLPVMDPLSHDLLTTQNSSSITTTPGCDKRTLLANNQSPFKTVVRPKAPILGFRAVSLLAMISLCGHTSPFRVSASPMFKTLEELRKAADRPIVLFPECTTSNGRGLLRFAKVFQTNVPVNEYQVFVMCVRYDPPTVLSPTLSWTIPSTMLNPIPHLYTIGSSLSLPVMSIRLLAPSESPSSQFFVASEVTTESNIKDDQLAEVCAALIAQIGKLKRTGLGWEEKGSFLDFYQEKRK